MGNEIIPNELIESKILIIRGKNVLLDKDIALLYGVETRRLNEQVKRNIDRFPGDFMFQLSIEEFDLLKSHFATSNWGGTRKVPYAFTEHGALMLATVLKSPKAITTSIQIIRIFTRLRQLVNSNNEMALKLDLVIKTLNEHDGHIQSIYSVIEKLLEPTESDDKKIGFV
ncbi:MAG: DNA-binding protein [Candidatus Margulisbacteria bacterium GWF2_35_9]|nr:MAG: DNA-binding protein [Candidatus Margulisbacteria bacterium GWF2_35_9]